MRSDQTEPDEAYADEALTISAGAGVLSSS